MRTQVKPSAYKYSACSSPHLSISNINTHLVLSTTLLQFDLPPSKMRFTNAAFAAALPVLAFGAPAPNAPSAVSSAASALFSAVHSAECKAVNVVVTVLELMPTATPFCSSYLGIQTVTTSPTTTVTAVVGDPYTLGAHHTR